MQTSPGGSGESPTEKPHLHQDLFPGLTWKHSQAEAPRLKILRISLENFPFGERVFFGSFTARGR
jgi:hypothetical protein